MNYIIFVIVYFMPWIMLGTSLILLGSFLYYIFFKNQSDIKNYLRSLFNLYGKYLILNIILSLIMLSVRLNMELIIDYAILYVGIFLLLNLFSFLILEFNFFNFESSEFIKRIQNKKLYLILITDNFIKIFFIVMMILNNIEY